MRDQTAGLGLPQEWQPLSRTASPFYCFPFHFSLSSSSTFFPSLASNLLLLSLNYQGILCEHPEKRRERGSGCYQHRRYGNSLLPMQPLPYHCFSLVSQFQSKAHGALHVMARSVSPRSRSAGIEMRAAMTAERVQAAQTFSITVTWPVHAHPLTNHSLSSSLFSFYECNSI